MSRWSSILGQGPPPASLQRSSLCFPPLQSLILFQGTSRPIQSRAACLYLPCTSSVWPPFSYLNLRPHPYQHQGGLASLVPSFSLPYVFALLSAPPRLPSSTCGPVIAGPEGFSSWSGVSPFPWSLVHQYHNTCVLRRILDSSGDWYLFGCPFVQEKEARVFSLPGDSLPKPFLSSCWNRSLKFNAFYLIIFIHYMIMFFNWYM